METLTLLRGRRGVIFAAYLVLVTQSLDQRELLPA